MVGEPILIVDDTPVNLKLTRILLVNEGYSVLTAASAEEALDLLRSYHPSLILADIQLPGMDGLEMTRRIKADQRTRDITVVALTAFAMRGDEQKAIDAGCDGYITKPIDTRTLGNRLRALLTRRAEAETPAAPGPLAHEEIPAAELQSLRRRFLQEGQEQSRRLLLDLDGAFQTAEAARVAHQWVGTAGLLGYSALSRLARELQALLLERPVDAAQVRESLANLLLGFGTPREAVDAPVPETIVEALSGKCVGIVGLPAHETQHLCVALERVHGKAVFFEADTAGDAAALATCDLLVIYIRPGADSAWLDPNSPTAAMPTVFVGSREDLLGLDPAVQRLAAEFLMDSWQPEEALVRLSLALGHRPVPPPRPAMAGGGTGRVRVLIAEDDDTVLALVRTALQNSGMDCHMAGDGPQALDAARRQRFDAAILDVNMPGMDGYEVLAALRKDNLPLRIMLLTARQQEGDIIRGFTLGADDYVAKPFSPMELVARLKRLVTR